MFRELPREWTIDQVVEHHIPTLPGAVPEHAKHSYSMSDEQLDELKKQLRGIVAEGFILKSTAPCAAPVSFRPKQAGHYA